MASIFQASVPQEFDNSVRSLRTTWQWTKETVKYLEKVVRKSPELKKQPDIKLPELNELINLAKTCEWVKNHFVGHPYATLLEKTSVVCAILGKKEAALLTQSYDRSVLPIKIWVEEDYARILTEVQKCTKLKFELDKAKRSLAANPQSDKRKQKASEIEQIYERQFNLCKSELAAMTKVYRHHTTCLKLLVESEYKHAKFARAEIEKARAADDPLINPPPLPPSTGPSNSEPKKS